MSIAQIGAIVRYESLMHWRRRSLPAIAIFFLVALVGFSLIDNPDQFGSAVARVNTIEGGVEVENLNAATGEIVRQRLLGDEADIFPMWMRDVDLISVQNTLQLGFMLAIATQALLIAIMPMLAETIALDKQFKVREVLDAAPLPRWVYLAGKILAAWIGLIVGLVGVGVLFILFATWRYGAFDLALYAQLWMVIVVPGALVASGYTIILNALTPNRRGAVLVGVALIPLAVLMFSSVSITLFNSLIMIFDPNSPFGDQPYSVTMAQLLIDISRGTLVYAGGLAAVSVLVWALLRAKS